MMDIDRPDDGCWLCGRPESKVRVDPAISPLGPVMYYSDQHPGVPYWIPLYACVHGRVLKVGVACSDLCRAMSRALIDALVQWWDSR